jgi:hypothetical protein
VSRSSDSAKVEDEVERVLAGRSGELGQGRTLHLAVLVLRRLDDEQLVPLAVEQQASALGLQFLAHRGAPRGIAIDLPQFGRIVGRHRRLPRLHALEQVRAVEA